MNQDQLAKERARRPFKVGTKVNALLEEGAARKLINEQRASLKTQILEQGNSLSNLSGRTNNSSLRGIISDKLGRSSKTLDCSITEQDSDTSFSEFNSLEDGHSISAPDAIAQLDQRITQRRNEHNGTADDNAAKNIARNPTGFAPGIYRVPPAVNSQLSDMEKDVLSKVAAVPRVRALTLQPGVYNVAEENPSAGPATLRQLEADVASKTRASASAPSTTVQSLNRMEADIHAKQQARSSRMGLSEVESDIAAKSVARSRPSGRDLEAKFRASSHQSAPAVSQGARRELDQMEAAITKKGSEPGSVSYSKISRVGVNHLEVACLDERTAYKTGISMQQDVYDENADADSLARLKQSFETAKYEGYDGFDGDDEDVKGIKLAIAEPVRDDDDDVVFIPTANEYDPDAKPPIYKNRRFRLYACLGGILLLALVAGLVFGLLSGSDKAAGLLDDGDTPSLAPSTYRESLGIQDQVELVVGSDKLNDPSTPHYQAMEWILHEDKLQLTADDPNLVQRYLLVIFYMQTTQDGDWISCGRADDEDSFCLWQTLIAIWPHQYVGIPWIRWLSDDSECNWAGVLCDEFNTTRAIDLCKF
jgi:hypothetical protein